MSVWDDHAANMLWLDSNYPLDKPASTPGVARGPCATTSGVPKDVEANQGNSQVTFSNIRFGDIGSTYTGTAVGGPGSTTTSKPVSTTTSKPVTSSTTSKPVTSTTTSKPVTSTSSSAPPSTTGVAQWGQCGGIGYSGSKTCVSPYTCHLVNDCKHFVFALRLLRELTTALRLFAVLLSARRRVTAKGRGAVLCCRVYIRVPADNTGGKASPLYACIYSCHSCTSYNCYISVNSD
jgi:hypothetical protein